MGKRTRKGPLNSIVDHAQLGEGSALMEVSEAARKSGGYDVWSEAPAGATQTVKVCSAYHSAIHKARSDDTRPA